MAAPPISFDALAKTAANPASGGYPYSLKGADLDKNFVFATEDFETTDFTVTNGLGAGGHANRKVALKNPIDAGTAEGELLRWNSSTAKWEPFGRGTNAGQMIVWGDNGWQPAPAPPATGTAILGAVGGALQWIATEEC